MWGDLVGVGAAAGEASSLRGSARPREGRDLTHRQDAGGPGPRGSPTEMETWP